MSQNTIIPINRSEEPRDTSWTSTKDSNYPRRSQRDSSERRDTWKNPSRDPSGEQGGGSQGGGDARGSPRMKWRSGLDDGRRGCPTQGYRIYKRRQDEVSRGQRKQQKEDDIRPEKRGHWPTVSWRVQNPEGFYSEDWNKVQQEEDKWQAPENLMQMVFRERSLEINPAGGRAISSLHT